LPKVAAGRLSSEADETCLRVIDGVYIGENQGPSYPQELGQSGPVGEKPCFDFPDCHPEQEVGVQRFRQPSIHEFRRTWDPIEVREDQEGCSLGSVVKTANHLSNITEAPAVETGAYSKWAI
jgi:hypothetical protein